MAGLDVRLTAYSDTVSGAIGRDRERLAAWCSRLELVVCSVIRERVTFERPKWIARHEAVPITHARFEDGFG